MEVEVDRTALGDGERVGKGGGNLAEQRLHFRRRAQVVGVARHAHAVGRTQFGVGLDA